MASRQRAPSQPPAATSLLSYGKTREEVVRMLLAQIYARAERQRIEKQAKQRSRGGKAQVGPLPVDGDDSPLSLIELIQASGPLFERYGIGAPDDAMYHRHLLSLSINPDPNWRKKIAALRLDHQSREQRQRARLTLLKASRSPETGGASSLTGRKDWDVHVHSHASPSRQRRRLSSERGGSQGDLFGDVLRAHDSFPSEQSPRALIRPASPAWSSHPLERSGQSSRRSRSSDDESAVAPSPFTSVRRQSRLQQSHRRTGGGIYAGKGHIVMENSADKTSHGQSDRESAGTGATSDERRKNAAVKSAVANAQLLSTVFEHWRSTRDIRKLGKTTKSQDIRMRRALMPTAAIEAAFRWIIRSLPEQYAVSSQATHRDLFIPAALARRIHVTQKSSVSNLSLLNKFALRLLLSRVKASLTSWRLQASAMHAFRRRMESKQRSQALDVAFQCILQWRLFAETNKCLVERANWIALRYGRRVLRESIALWLNLLRERQHGACMVKAYSLKREAICWAKWRRVVHERQQLRDIHADLARKRAIKRWKRYTHAQACTRAQELTADSHLRLQQITTAWKSLRGHLATKQTRQFRVQHCHDAHDRRCKLAILNGWRLALEKRREMDELAEKFAKWRRLRLLRRWLRAWTNWVDVRLEVAEKLEGAARRRRKRLLATRMSEWKRHHQDAARLDAMRADCIRRSERERLWRRWRRLVAVRLVVWAFRRGYGDYVLRTHMQRWRAFSERASVRRAALSVAQHTHRYRVLAQCWRLMVQHMQGQRSKKQSAVRFLQHRRVTSQLDAFCKWSTLLTVVRTRRTQEERARATVRRAFLLRRMWSTWRKGFRLARLGDIAARNLDTYRKAHVLRVWKLFGQRKRGDRQLIAHALHRMGLSRAASSFYRWKLYALKTRRVRESACLVVRSSLESALRRCWTTWKLAHAKAQSQRQRLARVIDKWKSRRLHSGFHRWKARWSFRKRHRLVLQKLQLLSRERVVEMHFRAWKALNQLHVHTKREFADASKRLEQWRVRQTLERWRGEVSVSRARGTQLRAAVAHWQHLGLAAPFRRWRQFYKTRKAQKTQFAAVATHFHHDLAQKHFSRWKKWAQRAKNAVNRLDRARRQLQRLRMRQCIRALRSRASLKRRFRCICAQIAHSSASSALQLSFAAWKQLIAVRQAQATQQASQWEAIERCRLRISVRRWGKQTRMRRLLRSTLLKAAHLSQSTLLQQCFASWSKHARQRALRHALKQKALVFQVFTLLPLFFRGWRRYVDQQKRTRGLLLRASGFMRHRLEHRAFATWTAYTTTAKRSRLVITRWQHATALRCVGAWAYYIRRQKHLRMKLEAADRVFGLRRARNALRYWHQAVRMRRILRLLSGRQAERALTQVFQGWRRLTHRQSAAKVLVGRLQNQTLVRVFNSWRHRMSLEVTRRAAIRDRFAALWLADLCSECWSCWKRFARTKRLVQKLLVGKKVGQTRVALTAWRCEARRRKWNKQRALVIHEAAATQTKRVCWAEWRVRLSVIACVKAMRGNILQRRSRHNTRWRFDRWRSFACVGRGVREHQRRMQRQLLRTVFHDGFAAYSRAKASERALSLRVQETHRAFLRVWLAEEIDARVARISAAEQMARTRAWRRLLQQSWSAWLSNHARKQATRKRTAAVRQQILQLGSSRVSRTRTMIVRWLRLDLARVMRQWRVQAYDRRQRRRNALLAMNWWLSTTSRLAFQGWKHTWTAQKRDRVVHALHMRRLVKRGFLRWKAWHRERRWKNAQSSKARLHSVSSLSRAVFTRWRLVANTRRTRRRLVLATYRASCLRLLSLLMLEWKAFVVKSRTKRTQSTIARVLYQRQLLRACFGAWHVQVRQVMALRLELQANTERLQVLVMCSCFRAWRAWSERHRRLTRIMSTVAGKSDVRMSARVFEAWRKHVGARLELRCLSDAFYKLRRCRKGLDALKAARSRSMHGSRLLEKARVFRLALQGTQVASVFARWKQFEALARKTRVVTLQYLQGKLLPTYWRAWVRVVRRRASLNAAARAIAAAWMNISARRAWNALVAYRSLRQAQRRRLIRGESHFHARQQRTTVRFWRSSTEWQRRLGSIARRAVARWQMATADRCLKSWRQFVDTQQRLKASTAVLSLRSRQQRTLMAWSAWRKLFLVHQTGRRRNVSYYWHKWVAWKRGEQSLALLQSRIRAVVLKSTQRHTFLLWQKFVARRKMEKALTLLSSRFSDANALKRSYASWRAYVALIQVGKARMRAVIAHMQSRLVHSAFRSLAEYRDHRRRHRAAIARSDSYYSQQVVRRVLSTWKTIAEALLTQRQRLHRYVCMLQHAVQAKSFRSWASHVAHRRDLRKRVARALAMRTQTLFFDWRRFVVKAKQNQRVAEFQRAHASTRAFKHWRQLVVLNKVERMMGACTKRSLESSFVAWRKRAGTSRHVRMFQLERRHKRHVGVLRCCFRAWRQWSSVRSRCTRILSRMASDSRLRLRFLLWRKLAAKRRRLSLLLQPVSAYPANGESTPLDGSVTTDIDNLRAQLAAKARFFQRLELAWDQRSVWRYWRLAFHAVLFHRLRALQRHFLGWKHHSDRRKRSRLVVTALTGARQQSSLRSVFTSWRGVVRRVKQLQAERQRERQLWTIANTEMLRRDKRKLRAHFANWHALIQAERHLQASADAYHRARLVTKVWLAWRHDFHELAALVRRRRREQQRQLRRHALARAVKALDSNRSSRKRVRLVVEYCLNKRNDELLPRILAQWHKWATHQRASAEHRERIERTNLRRVLCCWKAAIRLQRRHYTIIAMLSEQRVSHVSTRVLALWKRFVRRKRHSRRLLECAVAFRVRSLLRSRWRDHALDAKSRRERLDLAGQQLVTFKVRRAAQKWRSIVRHRALQRLHRSFVQRKFLSQWHSSAKLALASRFHEWTRRLLAKRMLVEWRSTARRLALWRQLTASVSSLRLVNAQRRAWRTWLAFVDSRRLARLAIESNARRLLRRSLCSWSDRVGGLVEEREARLEAVVGRLEDGARQRVFTHWRALAQRAKQRQFVVLACVFKLDGLRQKRVLQAVVTAWRRHTQVLEACRNLMERQEVRALEGAVRAWRAWMAAKRAQHQRERRADRYFTQRLVGAAFFYWQNYALAWREADAGLSPRPSAVLRSGLSRLSVGEAVVNPMAVDELNGADTSDSDDQESHRPLSPVMKRLGKRRGTLKAVQSGKGLTNAALVVSEEGASGDREAKSGVDGGDSVTPALADAVELSVGVRKRLEVLGPWRSKRLARSQQ